MQVAYVLNKPFGANKEGDVIHMDDEEAKGLMECGILTEAKEEDVNQEAPEEEEVAPEQNEALTRAVDKISRNLEIAIANVTTKALAATKVRNAPALSVPAEPRQEIYKCVGEMLKDSWLVSKG